MPREVKKNLSDIVGAGYKTFWNSRHRYLAVKGSRGSKKSKTTALKLISGLLQYPQANVLVIRRYERTLRNSCYSDLIWAIERLGLGSCFSTTLSPLEITVNATGQKILFRGMDDALKITSISVPKGVLCWVWCEEAYELQNEEEFNKLDMSIRGQMPEGLYKQIILTLNPWSETWWGKKRFFESQSDNVLALTTTWECNEWLDEQDRALFEDMKINHPKRYRVEGLGEWGLAKGIIYDKIELVDLDTTELFQKRLLPFHGLDFGFTDPTAYVGGFVDQKEKIIYVKYCFYKQGITNQQIAEELKKIGLRGEKIFCDSAEPKSIEELRRCGINAHPATKGSDSVRFGIQAIQNYAIKIDVSCQEFYNEISNYAWAEDRHGNVLDRPEHDFSHGADALRYGVGQLVRGSMSMKMSDGNLQYLRRNAVRIG